MQLWHKLRYLAGWTCTVTCGFLLFCDTLIFMLIQWYLAYSCAIKVLA